MTGRIFSAFLIIFIAVILVILPTTNAIYDFRTDKKLDRFTIETAAGVTTANVTLNKILYSNDTSTIELSSSDSDDAPLFSSYNTTTRLMVFSGMAPSTNRTLSATYDTAAFSGFTSIGTIFDSWPFIYYVIVLGFVVSAQVAIWMGKQ